MLHDIILDVSRLLSRVLHATPTGVDRVEMAYARGLMAAVPERLRFAAVHPAGLYGRLPVAAVARFLDRTERRWEAEGHTDGWELRRFAVDSLKALRPRRVPRAREGTVYVQASPHHLTRPVLVEAILRRERARFVCLVHDLIPIEFPEYTRPDGAAKHLVRVDTIVRHADGIVANSAATLAALAPALARAGSHPATRIAHLGTPAFGTPTFGGAAPAAAPADEPPYFVCVGTIEPRKNHLLLLNLWRRFCEGPHAAPVPRLVLIGRRGWENEQVVDMLDRCPALRGCVIEHAGLSDRKMRALIAGARALLLPSFAEGYGMPVAEALSLGTPVICSDLPALREAGGDVPDYLDPLDGPGWSRAIRDYAIPGSARRARQLRLLSGWAAPTWEKHLDTVLALIKEISA